MMLSLQEGHICGGRVRVLATLLLVGFGVSVGVAQTKPKYEDWTKYVLSAPDYRLEKILSGKWPYVEVVRKDRWDAYEKCRPKVEELRRQGQPIVGDPCNDGNTQNAGPTWAEAQAHEYYLPLSTVLGTVDVARKLRLAWQRFEERYYWRVITELNNPGFWFAYCLFGLKGPDLNPPDPPVSTMVPSEAVEVEFLKRVAPVDMGKWASQGLHKLDRYLPIPQVPSDDFCDGLGMQILPLMYIPGFKVLLQGNEIFRTPGYPSRPLWFNWNEANARVERAMDKAFREYYLDYQKDVVKALYTPQPSDPSGLQSLIPSDLQSFGNPKVYLPVPWQGHLLSGGSVVAPVMNGVLPTDVNAFKTRLEGFWDTYKRLSDKLDVLEKAYVYVHFYRSIRGLFLTGPLTKIPGVTAVRDALLSLVETPLRTLLQGIPVARSCGGSLDEMVGCAARVMVKTSELNELAGGTVYKAREDAPGLWAFEEMKRWLPPSSLVEMQAFGYVPFFQAMNFLEVTTVPDIRNVDLSQVNLSNWVQWGWSQLSRLVVYWHVPITIDIRVEYCPPCVIAYPSLPLEGPVQPLAVPPYVLPFALERTHWRWISVPEGYEVPGVKGTPYRVLGDVSALGNIVDLSALYRAFLGR